MENRNKDNLEKYISQHKEEFDVNVPPMVWNNVEKFLQGNEKSKERHVFPLMKVMSIAAMMVVVLGVGLVIGVQLNKNNGVPAHLEEFYAAENHYNNQVNMMMTAVKTSGGSEPSIEDDIKQLDIVYEELKKELLQNPNANTEQIINAMLINYQTKLEILETVLSKYQSNKEINIEDDKVEI